jgi:hypothetical protein
MCACACGRVCVVERVPPMLRTSAFGCAPPCVAKRQQKRQQKRQRQWTLRWRFCLRQETQQQPRQHRLLESLTRCPFPLPRPPPQPPGPTSCRRACTLGSRGYDRRHPAERPRAPCSQASSERPRARARPLLPQGHVPAPQLRQLLRRLPMPAQQPCGSCRQLGRRPPPAPGSSPAGQEGAGERGAGREGGRLRHGAACCRHHSPPLSPHAPRVPVALPSSLLAILIEPPHATETLCACLTSIIACTASTPSPVALRDMRSCRLPGRALRLPSSVETRLGMRSMPPPAAAARRLLLPPPAPLPSLGCWPADGEGAGATLGPASACPAHACAAHGSGSGFTGTHEHLLALQLLLHTDRLLLSLLWDMPVERLN